MTELSLPTPTIDTAPWWQLLQDGSLTIPTCDECKERHFPPQPRCPRCGSRDTSLVAVDGTGTVYSWVTTHRSFGEEWRDDVPYAIAAVDLDDGARLMGRFLGDHELLAAGLRVVYAPFVRGGTTLLGFRPLAT